MTILNLLLDLIDSLSLLSSLNPCALYPGEFLYWRLGAVSYTHLTLPTNREV